MDSNHSVPTTSGTTKIRQLLPVLFCFFTMGFVDLVGSASNFVKEDLGISASATGFIPSLVFFWFFVFSVPTSMLMNRIGRKRTVIISLYLALFSLIIPLFNDSYMTMLIAFSMLGIGNAVLQTSLNPLVSSLISSDKFASTLTFGQFVKALASLLAPYLMVWGATSAIPAFGLGWKVIFPIFGFTCLLALLLLNATPIRQEETDKATGFKECLRLLKVPFVAICFLGIMCHVGIDVGANAFAPQVLGEKLGFSVEDALIGTQIYFYFRTAGCLLGTWLLAKMSAKVFFGMGVGCMLLGAAGLALMETELWLLASVALVGLGNSNVFSVVFSQAISRCQNAQNEVSGLMIMGLIGGTVFPLFMGFAQDLWGIVGAVAVLVVAMGYLAFFTSKIKRI